MANQPQDMKAFKGQINYNSGATPPKSVTHKSMTQAQNLKRIKHNAKLGKHNQAMRGE